jgi:hypothetical protein
VDISDDDFLSVMDADGTLREDLSLPEGVHAEVAKEIRAMFDEYVS